MKNITKNVRPLGFISLLAALVILPGCATLRHGLFESISSAPSPAQVDADAKDAALPLSDLQTNLLDVLPPQTVTPGLVVCEPVTTDASRAAFGAGCSRWLHLFAAGQGALGQTPNWNALYRAEAEMKRPNLQFSLVDAERLAVITGVPYVAVGTLDGTSAHGALVYQIYSVPDGKAVGKPIHLEGTDTAIIADLPNAARVMDAALGVSAPAIPGIVGLTPEQLTHLGQDATQPARLTDAQKTELFMLSPNCPLANMIFISRGGWGYRTQLSLLASHLFSQCPANPLAFGLLADEDAYLLLPAAPDLARDRETYPSNSLFALADVKCLRMTLDHACEEKTAEVVAGDAPRNPEAWLTYAYTMSNQSSHVRKGRFASDISPAEWTILKRLYGLHVRAASEAVALDPNYGKGWDRLAQAATFDSDSKLATASFWKALELDSDKSEVYVWGLQMFQSKWGGSSFTLDTVADKAAADTYPGANEVVAVAQALDSSGETTQEATLLDKATTADQAWVAKEPNNGMAHWELAALLRQSKDMIGATREYRTAARLLPKNADVLYWLGNCFQERGMMAPSLAPLRACIALDPSRLAAHYEYGLALKEMGNYPDAEAQLKNDLRLEPDSMYAHFTLAELYGREKKFPEAVAEDQASLDKSECLSMTYARLCVFLDAAKRYDDALALGRVAMTMKDEDPDNHLITHIMTTMADCYLNKHDPKACLAVCREQLAIKPDDPFAYENIAEAELQEGDLTAAKQNWKKVASLDTGEAGDAARKYLAKYP